MNRFFFKLSSVASARSRPEEPYSSDDTSYERDCKEYRDDISCVTSKEGTCTTDRSSEEVVND